MTEIELKNKKLCEKYPFLIIKPSLYWEDDTQWDYSSTWEDAFPEGWRRAFCPQIWEELKNILAKANYVEDFTFSQIKEKYGTLRLYHNGAPMSIYDEFEAWESKYVKLSEEVCINCGKPAEVMTPGWISFICKKCAEEYQGKTVPIEDIDIFYKDPETYWKNKN